MLAPWVVWWLLRVAGPDHGGRLTGLLAFTPLVAFASPVPLVVILLMRRWVLVPVAVLVVVGFAALVLPRALVGPTPAVSDGVPLRVLTLNLHLGRADPAAVVALARTQRADVVSLQEVTPLALAGLRRAGLRRWLPHAGVVTDTAIFSRLPLRPEAPLRQASPGQTRALVRVAGAPAVELTVVHPPPPVHNGPAWRGVLRDLPPPATGRALLRVIAGDFNATLDHRELRRLLGDGGYLDAADATGTGLRMTWPANRSFPALMAIDHVLADPRVAIRTARTFEVPGTDHRALLATLELPHA